MIKVNILSMKNFLSAVNACLGNVYMLDPCGSKVNINREEAIQRSLWEQFRKNKNYLRLSLVIPDPKDYMNLVSSYVGNC